MPIKDIQELNLPQYATLSDATFSAVDMGDRTISTQLQIDGDITPDFSFDWEVLYRNEKYIYKFREPQASKDTSSQKAKYDILFRHWAIDKLTTEYYVKLHGEGANTVIDQYVKPINYDLKEFCDEFNKVLTYYWGNSIQIDLNVDWEYSKEKKLVSISYTKLWDLLQQMYQLFEVRWIFEAVQDGSEEALCHEKYIIKVGYPAPEIDKIFEYGKSANGEYGGLVKFERQQQDNNIANKLLGRGGEKNLPLYYFKTAKEGSEWDSDPDAIPETENLEYYGNLRGQTYRDYVRGFGVRRYGKAAPPISEQRWAYIKGYEDGATDGIFRPIEFVKDDESIAKFGEITGGLDNNDDIFPTIQGIEVDPYGRIDECVDVEQVTSDEAEDSTTSESISNNLPSLTSPTFRFEFGETKNISFSSKIFEVKADISPATLVYNYIISGTNIRTRYRPWVSMVKNGTPFLDVNKSIKVKRSSDGVEFPYTNLPEGSYYIEFSATIKNNNTEEATHGDYTNVTADVNSIKIISKKEDGEKWKPTFNIWVKNIWGTYKATSESDLQYVSRVWNTILGDREGNEAAIMFSDGNLAHEDYEFTIIKGGVTYDTSKSLNGVQSEWRLTLAKSDAEVKAIDKLIPATTKQGSAGDKFFFIGIDMPHQYVLWAEDKLDKYKEDALLQTAKNNPTFVLDFDHVQWDKWTDKEYEEFIGDIHEGYRIRATDKRFITDEAYKQLYVQSKEVKWENGKLLKRPSIVVTDKVMPVINPINQIQGQVDSLQSQLVGLSTTEQFIRSVGDKIYLRKDGVSDRSISPTQFAGLVSGTKWRQGAVGGSDWGIYRDEQIGAVIEADRIIIRGDLQVNNLVVNQVTAQGGKQIESAAIIECNRVDDTAEGYVCYFDQKQGSLSNLFKVDDVAYSQIYDALNTVIKYYKRKVIAVGLNTITLSKTDVNGSGIPYEGDVIIQYGNYTDAERQYVIIRDVIGGGYERMLSGLNSVNTDGVEYYFAGRQTGQGIRWFVGDANNNIEYKNRQLNVRAKVTFTSGSSGLGNLDEWAEAEEKIDNAQTVAGEAYSQSVAVNDYVQVLESEVNAEIIAVNKRLDGVIENYFELYDPTLNNYPANEWITDKLKEDHNGDTFTNKTNGNSWKWKIIGGVWKWDEITDTFEKELLNKIAKAQETADGKIRNFIFEPYPPYSVGDTWTQGNGGDFMRCIVSRAAGVFEQSDWDKASKYTDDTVANKAEADASAAQNTANAAKSSADAANIKLTDWASDSMISPTEKTALKQQRSDMQSEYAEVIANAGKYAVGTQSYTNAYTAAIAALAKYTATTPESIPIEADYANIAAYYPARQIMLEQISAASKAYSEKLVDEVQVGGVNLLKGTAAFNVGDIAPNYAGWGSSQVETFRGNVVKAIGTAWNGFRLPNFIEDKVPYDCMLSFYARVDSGATDFISITQGGLRVRVESTQWKQYSVFLPAGIIVNNALRQGIMETTSSNKVYISSIKLEKGNKPTDWSPAPEDVQAEINAAKSSADAANISIAAMNDDGIFDIPEKQSIRTQWENISGISNTVGSPITATGGSYINILNAAASLSVATTSLTAAFDVLKAYLNGLELYVNANKSGLNRSEMASKFTAYYDAELALGTNISKKQSLDQGTIDNDNFAKSLGYENYADMVSKGTIIDGGLIKTEVINTNQLVAESIRTNVYGKRVEIIGKSLNNNPRIRIFNDNNYECATISGDTLNQYIPNPESKDYLNINPVNDSYINVQSVIPTTSSILLYSTIKNVELCRFDYNGRNVMNIPSFEWNIHIHDRITTDQSVIRYFETYASLIINIQRYDDVMGVWTGNNTIYSEKINSNIIDTVIKTPKLDAYAGVEVGMYRIYVTLSGYSNLHINNTSNNVITVSDYKVSLVCPPIEIVNTVSNFSALYSNGLLSYWGNNKYFGVLQLENEDFVRAICNKTGFKLNSNGLQLMAEGLYNNIGLNYIRSHDGLMIQWGIIPTGGGGTVYFPTNFYGNPFSIVISPIMYPGDNLVYSAGLVNYTSSRFSIWRRVTDADSVGDFEGALSWIAIGRWRL